MPVLHFSDLCIFSTAKNSEAQRCCMVGLFVPMLCSGSMRTFPLFRITQVINPRASLLLVLDQLLFGLAQLIRRQGTELSVFLRHFCSRGK